jgi:hypothetical protein
MTDFAEQARMLRSARLRARADAELQGMMPPHNGTATSKAAAVKLSTADADRWRILERLVDLGDRGATRDELVIHFNLSGTPIPADSIRPRVWECMEPAEVLARYGTTRPLLTTPGHKRKTQRGREAFVLVATLEGIQAVHRHRTGVRDAA